MASPSIQSATNFAAGTSQSIGYPGANTAGNTSVVLIWTDGSITVTAAPTDTRGNTYTLAYSQINTVNSNRVLAVYVAFGIAAGSNTVNVGFTTAGAGSNFNIVSIVEEPPCTAVHVANGAMWTSGVGTNPLVSLAGTSSNDIVVGVTDAAGDSQGAGSIGTNANFIVQNAIGDIPTWDGLSSGGTVNAGTVTTTTPSTLWAIVAVALTPAGGGGGGGIPVAGIRYVTA